MRSRLVAGSLLLGWLVMTGCTMTPIRRRTMPNSGDVPPEEADEDLLRSALPAFEN
jgi:hypothetical protein